MAAKAAAAMEAALPGGAGEPINTMVSDWSLAPASGVTRDNYLAINQGQLKHVATPFYVRLGLPYPWAGGSAVKDNYKLVNLGQLKYVFSFALNSRTVGQGAVQIPTAMLTAALAQWQALPVKPVGSSTDDFDGDGIPNLQEYLMNSTLFDPLDIDGDRILDSVEDAHPGVLSKLRFADAVADYDGDGVMNFEEVLLGLNLSSATTSGRVDAMSDAKVLAWGLAARKPLVSSVVAGTDALKTFWGQIDAAWITANVGNDYLNWLDATVVNGVAKGLTAFRTDVLTNHVWEPWNPGAAGIGGTPSVFHDANGNTIDMDGDSVPDFDRDADYLPDLWEYRYALNLRDSQDAAKDPDGDLLTNLQEYQAGTNPRLADSDGDGFADGVELAQLAQGADPLNGAAGLPLVLTLATGNFQTVTVGGGSAPLVIHVTQGGLPVSGAQVQFAVGTGGGSLRAADVAAATGTPVSLTTDANGTASAVYLAGASTGTAGVTATLGSSSGGSSVNFSLTIAEASVTYAYESSNAAPFGGVVGAFGAGNVPRNNPFEEPTLLADSKYMNAAWEKWTDAAAKQFYKSYGNIGHSWDSGHSGVIFPATQTDQTDQIVKRFNAEPSRYFSSANESGLLQGLGEIATYQHFYNKTTDGPWHQPTSESEVQYRRVTALKVVTYVPQKEPAGMTFLALVYLGDSGWLPNSGDPRGTLQASGVIRVKGSASSWSPSLDAYCKEKEGAVIVDPGPEGEKLIGKTDNKHIRVELLRVEVVDANKAAVTKLKVGKMSETGVLTGTGSSAVLDIDKDSDRFFIRVPGGAALGGVSVKVSTSDNPDHSAATPYDDNATQIDLATEGADAISKSLLMVSDDVDDGHPVDGIADDATGDRTHRVQLGGNFKIEEIKIGTGAWQTLGAKVPVPVEKTVDVTTVILRDKPQAAGGVELISPTVVTSFWKIANERYAQCGVRLSVTHAGVKDPPTGVDLSDGLYVRATANPGAAVLSPEAKALVNGLGTGTTNADIHVFYVDTITVGSGQAGGIAIGDYNYAASEDTFLYNVFLTNSTLTPWGGYAAAHELGHLLTDGGHSDASGAFPLWHLMQGAVLDTNGISGSRRLKQSDASKILANPHAH